MTDPFGVSADVVLDSLSHAVDPVTLQAILDRGITELGPAGDVTLQAVRVVRYKPQRRCMIEYDLTVTQPPGGAGAVTVIGKVRRHRPGRHQHRLLRAFWDAGFDAGAADAICVPQPMGEVPELAMWLQRRVTGVPATELLTGPQGAAIAPRLADAAHKIHLAAIPTNKSHRIADELHILGDCLETVADGRPELAARIHRLIDACHRAARATPVLPATGIHRDFYPEHVLVEGQRLWIVDFDQWCLGDPALDIGNFVAHLEELALRKTGNPLSASPAVEALVGRYLELAGHSHRVAIDVYTALSLARLVGISRGFEDRRELTSRLADHTETRFAAIACINSSQLELDPDMAGKENYST